MKKTETNDMQLSMITQPWHQGVARWFSWNFCTDHWGADSRQCLVKIEKHAIMKVLQNALDNNIDTIKTENLYVFDGEPAFSLGQGQ